MVTFAWFLCSFGPPSYTLVRGWMPLHATVLVNYKRGTNTNIKAQVSSIWAKGGKVG